MKLPLFNLHSLTSRFVTFGAAALLATPAAAHHAMDGELPQTFMQGLLSGLAHPVIGLDHLAMVIAVGVAAGLVGSALVLPLAFIIATVVGVGLHLSLFDLPMAELVIALSVVGTGALIASGKSLPLAAYGALFAVIGVFHGYAYGESIVGAEQSPLVAYIIGFAVVQFVVASSAAMLTSTAGSAGSVPIGARLTGAAVAGIGFTIFAGQILPAG